MKEMPYILHGSCLTSDSNVQQLEVISKPVRKCLAKHTHMHVHRNGQPGQKHNAAGGYRMGGEDVETVTVRRFMFKHVLHMNWHVT